MSDIRPIFGTDLSKPLSETVEDLRGKIAHVRGQLSDIAHAFPGWRDRVDCVQGLLTCGLIALHGVREEMLKVEASASSIAAAQRGER